MFCAGEDFGADADDADDDDDGDGFQTGALACVCVRSAVSERATFQQW